MSGDHPIQPTEESLARLEQERKERRAYALLQAAAKLLGGSGVYADWEDPVAQRRAIKVARELLAEIERTETEEGK